MRAFDLVRDEDETGISGTGRVAEGVVFDDGHVVMRWLTAHRSTTFFPSIETVELIHGHGGKTHIVYPDGNGLVELPKPHLGLGNEGEFADGSQYDQCGAGPADLRAHIAYDRLGKVEAPAGWTGHACWDVGGDVTLQLRSPARYLGVREVEFGGERHTEARYEQQQVDLAIAAGGGVRYVGPGRCGVGRPGQVVRVAGVEHTAEYREYTTLLPREAEAQKGGGHG